MTSHNINSQQSTQVHTSHNIHIRQSTQSIHHIIISHKYGACKGHKARTIIQHVVS